MKTSKRKRNTHKNKGGAFKTDSEILFSVKNDVYDDKVVQNEYSTFKSIVKSNDFFKNNDDLLRNIFEFSVKAGKKFKVIQQFLEKYPKLEKVIIHFLGYPTQDTSEYFDISENYGNNFTLLMDGSMENNYGPPSHIHVENFQSYLTECIQIKVLDNFFKILNETEYAEPINATALEQDALRYKIENLKGFVSIMVNLKRNKSKKKKGIDDLTDGVDNETEETFQYQNSVWSAFEYSDVRKVYTFNKNELELECSTHIKTPPKTVKRKQYPPATRKSARLQR